MQQTLMLLLERNTPMTETPQTRQAVELQQLRRALLEYLDSPNGSPEASEALGNVIELVDGGLDPEKPEPSTTAPKVKQRSNQVSRR